jgi:hypothetical protein
MMVHGSQDRSYFLLQRRFKGFGNDHWRDMRWAENVNHTKFGKTFRLLILHDVKHMGVERGRVCHPSEDSLKGLAMRPWAITQRVLST